MLEFPGRLCFMRPQLLEFPVWALKNTGISRMFVLGAPKSADFQDFQNVCVFCAENFPGYFLGRLKILDFPGCLGFLS